MFGPCLGPWRRNGIALTVAAATLSLSLASGTARAGDAAPEAVIGTFETVRDARAAAGKPATFDYSPATKATPAAAPDEDTTGDDEVSRLYADAMDAMEAGETAAAQRKLEQVVARDPDGHLAGSARGYLADLYRGAPTTPRVATPPAAPRTASAPPKFETPRSGLGAGDIARDVAKPALKALPPLAPADSGIAVATGIEEEFIVSAGDRVFFPTGSAELGQRARIVLAAQARWLTTRVELSAVVEGHADDGAIPMEQSAQLSQARASAVRERLIAEGVSPARLSIVAQGRAHPVADCPGSDCAAQNRRVVTVLRMATRDLAGRSKGQSLASEVAPRPTQ